MILIHGKAIITQIIIEFLATKKLQAERTNKYINTIIDPLRK